MYVCVHVNDGQRGPTRGHASLHHGVAARGRGGIVLTKKHGLLHLVGVYEAQASPLLSKLSLREGTHMETEAQRHQDLS